jgi:hypothetical protein
LEAVEDGLAGYGCIHAAEMEDRVIDGGSTIVKRFHNEAESWAGWALVT